MSFAVSFRDPGGICILRSDKVLRVTTPSGLADLERFLTSDSASKLVAQRRLVSSRRLDETEVQKLRGEKSLDQLLQRTEIGGIFEHDRIEFPSFPHEWSPEMLHAAGMLTLDICQAVLADGFGLKDATPGNVLFRGGAPVFIDLLSFERRDSGNPIWNAHAQFCRNFILPLIAFKYWGVKPAAVFLTRRDGLEPDEVYNWLGAMRRFWPPFLFHVSLPKWLSRRANSPSLYRDHTISDTEKSRFILDSSFSRLRRSMRSLEPGSKQGGAWSGYMNAHSYSSDDFKAKEEFVRGAVSECRPLRLLDVGANTGYFSALAAQCGARVVAIDNDTACAGAIWRQAQASELDILPLVVDFSRPSPAVGWRNRECASFLDRAAGAFDMVLMLAVLHHLIVTERIPLEEVIQQAAAITTDHFLIEFVGPQDEMFRTIARGRDGLHKDLNEAAFEAAFRPQFDLVRSTPSGAARRLYLLRKKSL
jgi:SAM-dependent methyltransferase